jgi:predicted phosphoribosyltransferase
MPAWRRHHDTSRLPVVPFGSSSRCRTRSRRCARKRRGHLLREPISLGAIGFCYRDFLEMSDDEVTNLLGPALRPIERDRAWWMT